MGKEFIPYEIAVELKELGFDEPCFGYYLCKNSAFGIYIEITSNWLDLLPYDSSSCKAPLYQQAFEFFRDKYNLHHSISVNQRSCKYHFKIRTIEYESDLKPFGDSKIISEDGPRKKYEDIELDCLVKLIEIVKKRNNDEV
jgi:hypothetical protein